MLKTVLNMRNGRQILRVLCIVFESGLGCVSDGGVCFVYRLRRTLESSIKNCESLLLYACKKGVPVIKGVRNSGFSFRVNQE